MSLIPLKVTDDLWDSVIHLDQTSLRYPWKVQQWNELGLLDRGYAWRLNGEVVGFVLLKLSPLENLAHLLKIAVRDDIRGRGAASQLWLAIEAALREQDIQRVYLEVESENAAALRFYERHNFVKLRCITGFYADGANAWTMEKTL